MALWDNIHDKILEDLTSRQGGIDTVNDNWPKVKDLPLIDVAFQYSPARASMADKLVALRMLAGINAGDLAIVGVEVGVGPSPDIEADDNNAKLADLPHPFTAEFMRNAEAGLLVSDGYVEWSEPIEMISGEETIIVPPRAVPLEVGYMPCGKMQVAVIAPYTGLARWPYGSNLLTILLNRECIK